MLMQKGRHFRNALIWGFAALVIYQFTGRSTPFAWGLLVPVVFVAAILFLKAIWSTLTHAVGETEIIRHAQGLTYQNFCSDTGIALDPEKRLLHLYEKPDYVAYPFDKIRGWSTNVQTGGTVYGGGLAVAAGNIGTAMANNKASGLFVDVKDIDHPRYRIVFSGRSREKEMTRWMEILRQHINQDV